MRAIITAGNLNWDHNEPISIIITTIEGQKGLFLYRSNENDANSIYRFYEEHNNMSEISINRNILSAANLQWNHKDTIKILLLTHHQKKGLFLFKDESSQ